MSSRPEPITNVSGKYGAPMGRRDTIQSSEEPIKLHLRYVPFVDGCYDQGGAYWGGPANLYVAWGDEDDETKSLYVRASSRINAKTKVLEEIPNAIFYR